MILSCGAKNFFSFKEGIEISFELSAKCPEHISKGREVSHILCVKGANASGKTNALRLLPFLCSFCAHSFHYSPSDTIPFSSFFLCSEPTEMYCDFIADGVRYLYELTLTETEVIKESLTRIVRRPSVVFERNKNSLECIREFSALDEIKLRSNASVISTANQYALDIIAPIHGFFGSVGGNVSMFGRVDRRRGYRLISEFYHEDRTALQFSLEIIRQFDTGIREIVIDEQEVRGELGVQKSYNPVFRHDTKSVSSEMCELPWALQSSGTKELFTVLPMYYFSLAEGSILVLDEFDTHLHSHLLPELIKLFDSEDSNPHGAQLLFSTHHDSVLDYMGKYRTILVNKEESESFAYRLDEIPGDVLRNDRPIAPIYNAGKLGGVPRL